MSNTEKVKDFLDKAKIFDFLTVDGDKPKGRPFGFNILVDDVLYFGTGTFKKVYKEFCTNPNVAIIAVNGGQYLRYEGKVKLCDDPAVLEKAKQASPGIFNMYDKNGWTMQMFSIEQGHVEIIAMNTLVEEFDC